VNEVEKVIKSWLMGQLALDEDLSKLGWRQRISSFVRFKLFFFEIILVKLFFIEVFL